MAIIDPTGLRPEDLKAPAGKFRLIMRESTQLARESTPEEFIVGDFNSLEDDSIESLLRKNPGWIFRIVNEKGEIEKLIKIG